MASGASLLERKPRPTDMAAVTFSAYWSTMDSGACAVLGMASSFDTPLSAHTRTLVYAS